ncbi:dTDP-4-dehydrorhamnose reductase [Flagellimonas allohymeniacidonis]|uniref:dTDP-4-dehydrorhamnose reductase n=1 Tax=Flagellimonas allohymeniacidonis TaxID=2517819 RepID=A0A4Q8QA28_9FLAO|nr:dTDP-4-dehydrorhamnose reductase [Allomuricauda hymeniacidonis]TAI47142.1 dTDP-4-dehydrorhamnose reductase [Allomuricauda hymeniacidonis]
MKILVTGASGQLGNTFKSLVENKQVEDLNFVFKSSQELDITDFEAVRQELLSDNYAYCINCAGYTNVDQAETEKDLAYKVNVTGSRNLALNCNESKTVLVHISTDFVFDGFLNTPYVEEDIARPIGFYGDTKYKGERAIINNLEEHFIIRTSWLYSEFGHNFMKTMVRLGNEKDELSVVYDQIGTPTYALDLALVVLHIIKAHSIDYGVYHYSNEGVASWYDFAKAIFEIHKIPVELSPILSEAYPTPAERPKFSVLDKSKIKNAFHLDIPHWRDSLKVALAKEALIK